MEIEYATKKLQKILSDLRLTRKYYGEHHKKIRYRISELSAASSLLDIPDIPPPRRHKLTGELKNCWGIDYSTNFRIIIRPMGEYLIDDLSTIRSILILDLCDYH